MLAPFFVSQNSKHHDFNLHFPELVRNMHGDIDLLNVMPSSKYGAIVIHANPLEDSVVGK